MRWSSAVLVAGVVISVCACSASPDAATPPPTPSAAATPKALPELVLQSIAPYTKLRECFWVQDEPCNMGAGPFVTPRIEVILRERANVKYECISRVESASPATGSHKAHVLEQQQILRAAFDPR